MSDKPDLPTSIFDENGDIRMEVWAEASEAAHAISEAIDGRSMSAITIAMARLLGIAHATHGGNRGFLDATFAMMKWIAHETIDDIERMQRETRPQ